MEYLETIFTHMPNPRVLEKLWTKHQNTSNFCILKKKLLACEIPSPPPKENCIPIPTSHPPIKRCSSIKHSQFQEKGWTYLPKEIQKAGLHSNIELAAQCRKQKIQCNTCPPKGNPTSGLDDNLLSFENI
jgi:hypothetical protein